MLALSASKISLLVLGIDKIRDMGGLTCALHRSDLLLLGRTR